MRHAIEHQRKPVRIRAALSVPVAILTTFLIFLPSSDPTATGPERPGGRAPIGLRAAGARGSSGETPATPAPAALLVPRAFAPVLPGLAAAENRRSGGALGSDSLVTPSGVIRLGALQGLPPAFSRALEGKADTDDAVFLHLGSRRGEEIHELLAELGRLRVRVLDVRPGNGFVVTGVTPSARALLARRDIPVLDWTAGLYVDPAIGMTPVDTEARARQEELTLLAALMPGGDETALVDLVQRLEGKIKASFRQSRVLTLNVHVLRVSLAAGDWDGLHLRALAEAGIYEGADEDTSTGVQTGGFRGGDRPYTEAGVDGSTQVIGITDSGVSLDATVLADSPAGLAGLGTANAAGASHRKVVAYTSADSVPGAGGAGDLLSCDGTTGATHGHLVASIAAGNASELLGQAGLSICDLSGFEPALAGCATEHGVDGVAPGARISFIDAQSGGCAAARQIEAQTPGLLSANSEFHAAGVDGVKGTADDARVHNYSFSLLASQGSYTVEAQDLDAWLYDNQEFLVVVAAGNKGTDAVNNSNLDFGTVTSPGTAKNVLTVGSSGYPNNALDPATSVVPGITNSGIELISRFSGEGSGQGPAAFTTQAGGTLNWRMKPDVMAPGDENLGNQRMTAPTTCVSTDDDQAGPTECVRLTPGALFGTSYAAAATSGLAVLVRDYFEKGHAPGGEAGGTAVDLTGPELKAAIIASTELMTGNPFWKQLGRQLQLAFYNPRHLAGYTPEQGYGRIQADSLLPLNSAPSTPAFIDATTETLGYQSPVTTTLTLLDAGEPLVVAAAWYDREASVAGSGADGKLMDDVDLTVRLCGADDTCGSLDDTVFFGNYFTEDSDFDRNLTDLPDQFRCSMTAGLDCDPTFTVCLDGPAAGASCSDDLDCEEWIFNPCTNNLCQSGPRAGLACTDDADCIELVPHSCVFDAVSTGCGTTNDPAQGAETCDLFFAAATEDCNGNGVLDISEFSLPVTGTDCTLDPADDGARDRNNSTEKVKLSPELLAGSSTVEITLEWVASADAPLTGTCSNDADLMCDPDVFDPLVQCGDAGASCAPRTLNVGRVLTGAFQASGAPNRVRLNRDDLSCTDVVSVSVLDGAADADNTSVSSDLTLRSVDCGADGVCGGTGAGDDLVIDQVQTFAITETTPGTLFETAAVAVVGESAVPAFAGDGLLTVADGGRVEAVYGDTPAATATARVRCMPAVNILNVVRRGTDADFNLQGGCDPRDRFDPRILVFGLVPGTGLNVTGDLFLDAGEQLVYEVGFASLEEDRVLLDVQAFLEACVAGTIQPDGTCTPAAAITIFEPIQTIGRLEPGKNQSARFNIRVAPFVAFPSQIEMRFGVSAARNGLTTRSETVFHHVLDADTWSRASESPAVSGVSYYSTDFPTGGQEIRNNAGEFFNPLDPDLQAELFVFQDATTNAFGGGNAVLGDAITGSACDFAAGNPVAPDCIANNWPWTFDLDDESFGTRRRFDSDPGDNLQLQNANVWQHNTDGACGFQSNAGACSGGANAGAACESNSDCDSGACAGLAGLDGPGGQGGIWHTGHTIANDPSVDPSCLDGSNPAACARDGYDLGCENYDIPFTVGDDGVRRFVLDTVSSPQFSRVHRNLDGNGFAYTLEFTRLAANQQSSIGDTNAILAGELDPDTTTPQPVDPLDMGWLFSDQGADGFLAGLSQVPYLAFNPNDPHDPTSSLAAGLPLDDAPGPGQTIREVHGPGSAGSFFDPSGTCSSGSPNAGAPCDLVVCGTTFDPTAPGNGQVPDALGGTCVNEAECGVGGICEANDALKAPSRSFGEISGVLTGRGLALPSRRGAGGLPVRNRDLGLTEVGSATFEDTFGPNESRTVDQVYPISAGNPELLVNRRDTFQVNFIAWLREDPDPTFPATPDYGYGIDDVVVEWREGHPVADRTPCSDPSTWAEDDNGNPVGVPSFNPSLAGGCAQIAWDRSQIIETETSLTLTIIDVNAQYGPDGIDQPDGAPEDDDQAKDSDGDGLAELDVTVFSDVDLTGERFELEQIAFASPVYQGQVGVSASVGKTSEVDGIIFIQANGTGANPTALTAQFNDQDINVAGAGFPVPCPDNPLTAVAQSQQVGADVLFVSARVTDETGDGDNIADDTEVVRLDLSLINATLDLNGQRVDLDNVTITLLSDDTEVACILDGQSFYGTLESGVGRSNDTADPFRFVVSNVGRTSPIQVIQASFDLGIRASFTDSLGIVRQVSSFATPQRFALNLDLDVVGSSTPLVADSSCVGGTASGAACVGDGVCQGGLEDGSACSLAGPGACETGGGICTDACPGLQGDGLTPATCAPLPEMYRAGGSSFVAGQVGYFEGFEGAPNMAGRDFAGAEPIPGTRIDHLPAINAAGGFLERAVRDYIDGGTGVLGGISPGSSPGNAPDIPEGSSAVDGSRCQYNDPQGPTPRGRSESACRPWDGSDWHVNDNKAFHGSKSLYGGVNGDEDRGSDISFDANHTNLLAAAFMPSLNIGVSGGATLSIQHIINMADTNTFSGPGFSAAGRGYLMAAPVDPVTGIPSEGGWIKLSGFQNNYAGTAFTPFFTNCLFDPYDDLYVSPFISGEPRDEDDVSTEDDYFDPNDPVRLLGPSSGCFPEKVYSRMGSYSGIDPNAGRAFTGGFPGETGTGLWVNSLFNLDVLAGKTVRLRFVQTDIDIAVGFVWADLFGNGLGDATRGWRLDDLAVTGLVDAPVQLVADLKAPPFFPSCSVGAECGSVQAEAGPDVITPVSGSLVTLSAATSTVDQCVNGFLIYRWRVGGSVVQDYSTNATLQDNPTVPTLYTVDVECSTDNFTCSDTDTVLVTPADQVAISGPANGPLTVTFDGAGPDVIVTGVSPAAGDVVPLTVRIDLDRNGLRLADGLGSDPDGPAVASVLKAGSCGLAIAAPNPAPSLTTVTTNDGLTALTAGDTVGYLQYPVTSSGLGAWGVLKPPFPAVPGTRGSLDPTALGFPSGTFAELSGLPPGTGGDCGP